MIFNNPLLEEEVKDILDSKFPEHTVLVSCIIHNKDEDYYPDSIVMMDVVRDYDGSLIDNCVISLFMNRTEFNVHLYDDRDDLQITVYIDYNGKVVKNRMKAIILSNPTDTMGGTKGTANNMSYDAHSLISVEVQCIPLLYAMIKNVTSNGVVKGSSLDNVIRHYLSTEMSKVTINAKKVEPIINMVAISNSRVYNDIVIDDTVTILDIPYFLQKKYGLYNGGIGTYLHTIDEKDVISIFPLYNSELTAEGKRLVVYIPDSTIAPDINNKTVLVDGDDIKIIVTSTSKRIDKGDTSDFDLGSGFKTSNSNQTLDRTFKKDGDTVSSDSTKSIDSQSIESRAGLAAPKMLGSTDNLYAIRSEFLRNQSRIVIMQWNFSRPDLLHPGMEVEVVNVYKGDIHREKGTLINSYSKYDNKYKNCTSSLNVLIN